MIPARFVTAWFPHAQWRSMAQVEQDLLLVQAMHAIFTDSFLSNHVAMRGGTVLHKVHLAPAMRYSEDIDLVRVTDCPPDELRRALQRVLKPILGELRARPVATVALAVRNTVRASTLMRLAYSYPPAFQPPGTMGIKIEVNLNEPASYLPLITHALALPPVFATVPQSFPAAARRAALPAPVTSVPIRTYELDELVATKTRALLQRMHGRDLYDLAILHQRATDPVAPVALDPARAMQLLNRYLAAEGSAAETRVSANTKLNSHLASSRFFADMSSLLPTGQQFDPAVAAAAVRAYFFTHLL
jgi:hypothetical protein